jgi:hypothetical protein
MIALAGVFNVIDGLSRCGLTSESRARPPEKVMRPSFYSRAAEGAGRKDGAGSAKGLMTMGGHQHDRRPGAGMGDPHQRGIDDRTPHSAHARLNIDGAL